MATPTHHRFRRAVRGFTLGSGPLKRGSDRVQMVARLVVLLAVVAAPGFAVAAATATTAELESVAAAEAAERLPARALVLEDAPARADSAGYGTASTVPALGQWTSRDGAVHQGPLRVAPGTRAGTTVPVWADRHGNLTRAPLTRQSIEGSAMATGAVVLGGVPLAAWILYFFLCFGLDARRDRGWEEDWAAVDRERGTSLQ